MTARVLIVEDELLLAESLEDMLTEDGHEVCGTARSADEAVRLARTQNPDVVLMDVKLASSRDGIHAAEEIRQRQTCRVVFLTAYADAATRDRIRRAVPDAVVLSKPASRTQIVGCVRAGTGDRG
jgi:DNA-binding NarL/FixJ family response regulator